MLVTIIKTMLQGESQLKGEFWAHVFVSRICFVDIMPIHCFQLSYCVLQWQLLVLIFK